VRGRTADLVRGRRGEGENTDASGAGRVPALL
jgi:hypothetical protein